MGITCPFVVICALQFSGQSADILHVTYVSIKGSNHHLLFIVSQPVRKGECIDCMLKVRGLSFFMGGLEGF